MDPTVQAALIGGGAAGTVNVATTFATSALTARRERLAVDRTALRALLEEIGIHALRIQTALEELREAIAETETTMNARPGPDATEKELEAFARRLEAADNALAAKYSPAAAEMELAQELLFRLEMRVERGTPISDATLRLHRALLKHSKALREGASSDVVSEAAASIRDERRFFAAAVRQFFRPVKAV